MNATENSQPPANQNAQFSAPNVGADTNASAARSKREHGSPGRDPDRTDAPLVSIFAIPKPFRSDIAMIQRNAISSWSRLGPDVEVMLLGNACGTGEIAQEYGARWISDVSQNGFGTPLLDHAFDVAHQHSRGTLLAYVNCDILLLDDFIESIKNLQRYGLSSFLITGRRTDVDMPSRDGGDGEDLSESHQRLFATGRLAPAVCKDYFVFTRDLFRDVPGFSVGRGNWDNWMVHSAKQANVPVIDATGCIKAIHQNHNHLHVDGGKWSVYAAGDEAMQNARLADGRHLVSGSTPDWNYDGESLTRRRFPVLHFWRDFHNFVRLVSDMWI